MKFFKRTDVLVLLGVLVLAFAIWGITAILPHGPAHAELYSGSTLLKTVALTSGTDERFSVEGEPEVVFHLFADGSICFESSNCPDKVCVRAGKLSRAGESAACLPNGLVLKIVADGAENDIIVS